MHLMFLRDYLLQCNQRYIPQNAPQQKWTKHEHSRLGWHTSPKYRILGSRTAMNLPSKATHCDIISFSASRCMTYYHTTLTRLGSAPWSEQHHKDNKYDVPMKPYIQKKPPSDNIGKRVAVCLHSKTRLFMHIA